MILQQTTDHQPYSIRKLCICDEKRRNFMSVKNSDKLIYSWIHYRFTCKTKQMLKQLFG